MKRSEIVDAIRAIVADFLGDEAAEIREDTQLLGDESQLDSIGLVTIVMDVEQEVSSRSGVALSLADDRAMSRRSSPFRSVAALADYVVELLEER